MPGEQKIHEMFIESCMEQLADVETAVLDIERADPTEVNSKIDGIFRIAHTIKGDAAALSLGGLSKLSHEIENILSKVKDGLIAPGQVLIGELLWVFDRLKALIQNSEQEPSPNLDAEFSRLAALAASSALKPECLPEVQAAAAQAPAASAPLKEQSGRIGVINIHSEQLDLLVDRMGELATLQARLTRLARDEGDRRHLSLAEELERLSSLLRNQVLEMRLLPLQVSFAKYRRLVRDSAAQVGKLVEFTMQGGRTELDKSVIEQINTPMIHLLRNAVDHGIEAPETRRTLGKPESGLIAIAARQEGNEIVIEVSDDGAGIDASKVRAKALELGLVEAGAELSEQEIRQLIFLPGFSTSSSLNQLSGRGVGMDAVKDGITRLRGRIEVQSRPGLGSSFILKLPISLAIIDCLLAATGDELYYFHLDFVDECIEIKVNGELPGVLNLRGAVLPLLGLRAAFDAPGAPPEVCNIVVVSVDGQKTGVVVDAILGLRQAVLKNLDPALCEAEGVLGATVTEDGRMALVVDIPELVRSARKKALER